MNQHSFKGDSYGRPVQGYASAQDVCAAPRKPTAAEYTEKRVSEVGSMLAGEIQRLSGQYNRLREHFGIPPEPCSTTSAQDVSKDNGMEYQLNRLHNQMSELTELITKMNELI